MDVRARTKFVRMSPSKGWDIARKVQGLPVSEALQVVEFSPKKAARLLGKTLNSAIANASNNADLDVDKLWVKLAVINDGPRLRRFWPRARGSASPIARRTCHIDVIVSDDAEGMGGSRKSRQRT